jgi:nitrogen PTS system EIIA component
MDLKLEEVSELLNVSEATIRRWLADGKIPAYQLNEQYRFSRHEIEDWLVSHEFVDDEENKHTQGGLKHFALFRAIHKGGVYHNVPGSNKEEIIKNSAKLLAKDHNFDPDIMADLLLDRENLMSTALNNGLAVPHTREITFNKHYDAVAIVFPKEPIEYGALDNEPVHTLFFLFACDDKRHLNLLAKAAHFSRDQRTVDFLKSKPTKNDILKHIRSWESQINS